MTARRLLKRTELMLVGVALSVTSCGGRPAAQTEHVTPSSRFPFPSTLIHVGTCAQFRSLSIDDQAKLVGFILQTDWSVASPASAQIAINPADIDARQMRQIVIQVDQTCGRLGSGAMLANAIASVDEKEAGSS
jgi:hypothetical protein